MKELKTYYDSIFDNSWFYSCKVKPVSMSSPTDCSTAEEWTFYEEDGLCFKKTEPTPKSSTRRCEDWEEAWFFHENCCPAKIYDIEELRKNEIIKFLHEKNEYIFPVFVTFVFIIFGIIFIKVFKKNKK